MVKEIGFGEIGFGKTGFGKIGLGVAAFIMLLVAIALFRTLTLTGGADESLAPAQVDERLAAEAAAHLGAAITFETISWGDERSSDAAFLAFHEFLERTYPRAHQAFEREVVNGLSLIYRWPGAEAGAKPVALAAHIDVVPVEEGDGWAQPPFSGKIAEGKVWGRGALDDKGAIIAMFEAAERLLAQGFVPSRDVYFLLGHDEEIGGENGAGAIVAHLAAKGVHFAWTLDEGSAPIKDVIAGYEGVAALISLGEKGSITLHLTAEADGGHSSTPGRDTAASILARAAAKITDAPYPAKIDRTTAAFLKALAPELPFAQRFALTNLWLTGPLVKAQLEGDPVTAATMRTTTAVTIIRSGVKTNVLPQKAEAFVNYRIHPRDTPEAVEARAIRLIDDARVKVRVASSQPASALSSRSGGGYLAIAEAIGKAHGGVIIAPSLTLQATDQRHYAKIADDAYRFFPFVVEPADLKRIHGADEAISVENLGRGIVFYEALLQQQ